jgi:hypothetical protein
MLTLTKFTDIQTGFLYIGHLNESDHLGKHIDSQKNYLISILTDDIAQCHLLNRTMINKETQK